MRPWPTRVRRRSGGLLIAAGSAVVGWSLKAAGSTDLASPDQLVTQGPYAFTRNPMYVGWGLLQLGVGLVAGSGWTLATVPAVGVWIHREVVREERRLEGKFGDDYRRYQDAVRRYVPKF